MHEDDVRGDLFLDLLESVFAGRGPFPELTSLKQGVEWLQGRSNIRKKTVLLTDQTDEAAQLADIRWTWHLLDCFDLRRQLVKARSADLVTTVLRSGIEESGLAWVCSQFSIQEALQNGFEVVQVLLVHVSVMSSIMHSVFGMRCNSLSITRCHYCRSGSDAKGQTIQLVEAFVGVESGQQLGLVVHFHLEVRLSQVDLGEVLATSQRSENVIYLG